MFKIAALKNIRNLFPDEFNPFYTGFGNRDTDAVSYRAVGISLSRIFIVNHDGEIHHFNSTYKKSYPLLHELVDDMFPGHLLSRAKEVAENIVDNTLGLLSQTKKPLSSNEKSIQKKIAEIDDEEPNAEEDADELILPSQESPERIVFKVVADEVAKEKK